MATPLPPTPTGAVEAHPDADNTPETNEATDGRSLEEARLNAFGLPLPPSRRIRERMAVVDETAAIDILVDATHSLFRERYLATIERATRKLRSSHLHQGTLRHGHPAGENCIECDYMIRVVTFAVHKGVATAASNPATRPPPETDPYVAAAARNSYIAEQRSQWSLQRIERDTPPVGEHAGLNDDEQDLLLRIMYFVNSNDALGDPWPIGRWSDDLNREPDDLRSAIDQVLDTVRRCCARHERWIAQRLEAPLSARLAECGVEKSDAIADVEIDVQMDAFDRELMEDLKLTYMAFRSTVDPPTALLCAIRDRHGPAAATRAEQIGGLDALVMDLGFETKLPEARGQPD